MTIPLYPYFYTFRAWHALLLCSLPSLALSLTPVSLHLGADYKDYLEKPNAEYRDIFPELREGKNFYAGLRFGNWQGWDWGIDVGWERSGLRTEQTLLLNNRKIFNLNSTAGDVSRVQTRFQGWHTDLMIYKNLVPCYVDLIFTGGVALMRPHGHIDYTPIGGANAGLAEDYGVTSEHKTIGRIGFGAQWMFLKWFGVRGLLSWSNNHPLSYTGQQNIAGVKHSFETHPHKSTMSLYVGVVARASGIAELPLDCTFF